MDAGSAARAAAAARLAARLGVPLIAARRQVSGGESREAAARRERYAFLEEVRRAAGARWVATAHHRDDQAETVLLRLLFGSGVEGLAGIRPVHGKVVRPLLEAPRAELAAAVQEAGLEAVDDPTNRDLAVPRNRVRHRLLPGLAEDAGDLSLRLARLGSRARSAAETLDHRLEGLLTVSMDGGRRVDRPGGPRKAAGRAVALRPRLAAPPRRRALSGGRRRPRRAAAPARAAGADGLRLRRRGGAGRPAAASSGCAAGPRRGNPSPTSPILWKFRASWTSRRSPSGCASAAARSSPGCSGDRRTGPALRCPWWREIA